MVGRPCCAEQTGSHVYLHCIVSVGEPRSELNNTRLIHVIDTCCDWGLARIFGDFFNFNGNVDSRLK